MNIWCEILPPATLYKEDFCIRFKDFRVFAVVFSSTGFFSFIFFPSVAELSGKMKDIKTYQVK